MTLSMDSVPLSCGEILPCGAWAGPPLCQHCHLGPNQDLTVPLRARACHPNGEQEEAGSRVQECGHSPHLGRAILGGSSGCLEPLPWIHVELIGQEDAGCPVSGGSEASMWCSCNTAYPGPRVVDPPPWSPTTELSVTTCCASQCGERWALVFPDTQDLSSFWQGLFWRLNGTPLQYSCLENPMDGGAW